MRTRRQPQHLHHPRRRRAVSTATGRPQRQPTGRAAPWCCSTAATNMVGAWPTWSTSWTCPDFDFFAWDARGHGQSPGAAATARARAPACATCRPSSSTSAASTPSPNRTLAVLAQSVGAVLVATWAHDYAPEGALPGARLAGLQGQALRARSPARAGSCCAPGAATLRQQLRQGEVPQPMTRSASPPTTTTR